MKVNCKNISTSYHEFQNINRVKWRAKNQVVDSIRNDNDYYLIQTNMAAKGAVMKVLYIHLGLLRGAIFMKCIDFALECEAEKS